MIKYRSAVAVLTTLTLAGATLGAAAPAFAKPAVVSRTQTITFGHAFGTGCYAPFGTVPNGSTSTTTVTYSDGSSTTTKATCQNGTWITTSQVLPVGSSPWGAVPNGSTVKLTVAYSNGSSTTTTTTCQNGICFAAGELAVGSVRYVAVSTTYPTLP